MPTIWQTYLLNCILVTCKDAHLVSHLLSSTEGKYNRAIDLALAVLNKRTWGGVRCLWPFLRLPRLHFFKTPGVIISVVVEGPCALHSSQVTITLCGLSVCRMVGTGTHHYERIRQESRTQKNTRLTNGNVNERNAVATNSNRSRLTHTKLHHLIKCDTRLARVRGRS